MESLTYTSDSDCSCPAAEVHRVLAFVAQAVNEFTPPDLVGNLVKTIADRFVSDRSKDQSLVIGLNAIREVRPLLRTHALTHAGKCARTRNETPAQCRDRTQTNAPLFLMITARDVRLPATVLSGLFGQTQAGESIGTRGVFHGRGRNMTLRHRAQLPRYPQI